MALTGGPLGSLCLREASFGHAEKQAQTDLGNSGGDLTDAFSDAAPRRGISSISSIRRDLPFEVVPVVKTKTRVQ